MRAELWAVVHAERQALANDLERLPAEAWATPSLCAEWDIHDVLAHLLDTARETPLRFIKNMATARFDFHRANADGLAAERSADPATTLARFRAAQERRSGPPAPRATRLIEAFVHGEDIRRPLAISRQYPSAWVARALLHHVRSGEAVGGGKARVAGVTLVATDTDVTIGTGPLVEGPVLSLLLAASGRRCALGDLQGPGVEVLAERA